MKKQFLLILVLTIAYAKNPERVNNIKTINKSTKIKNDVVLGFNRINGTKKQFLFSEIEGNTKWNYFKYSISKTEFNNNLVIKPIKTVSNLDLLSAMPDEINCSNQLSALENNSIVICDGDSRTDGFTGGTSAWRYSEHLDLGKNYTVYNTATGGATFTDNEIEGVRWITNDAYNVVTPLYSNNMLNNIVVIWAGFNDLAVRDKSPHDTFESLKSYCLARKSEGFKVIVVTEPSTTSIVGDERRLVLNSLVRNSVTDYADGLVDLEQNEFIGPRGTASNTKYFFDGVHMTEEGYGLVGALVRSEILNLISLRTVKFESRNKIQLVPNPSKNFIRILGLKEKVNYTIYNILGKEMSCGVILDNETIEIQNLAEGLYIIKFGNGNAFKFLKK